LAERKNLRQIELLESSSDPERDKGKVAWIERLTVRHAYEDGTFSRPYRLDVVSHTGYDAVGVLPYWTENGEPWVMLLMSFRPVLTFREIEPEPAPFMVEMIAGVLEKGEQGDIGVKRRAVEELREEAGLPAEESAVQILGASFYSSPGVYTEKLWVCAVEVDMAQRTTPKLDGSVMEEMIEPFAVALETARRMCWRGEIRDAKTEIALERLARFLSAQAQS